MKPRQWLVQTVKVAGGCAAAYATALALGLPDGFWAPISAAVVTQPLLDGTLAAARQRVLATVIGAAVGFAVLLGTHDDVARMPLFWLGLLALAGLTARWPNMRLSVVTLIVIVLVPATGAHHFARPLDRVLEIVVGTVCAVLTTCVLDLTRLAVRKRSAIGDGG